MNASSLLNDPRLGELAVIIGMTPEALIAAISDGEPVTFRVAPGYSAEADRLAVLRAVRARGAASGNGLARAAPPVSAPSGPLGRVATGAFGDQIRSALIGERARQDRARLKTARV